MIMSFERKSRISTDKIREQKALLTEKKLAEVISEFAEEFVGILNRNLQYVVVNEKYFDDNPCVGELVGQRPGEAFGCVHSGETVYGCGNSASCGYCDVMNTLVEVLDTERRVTRDGHLLLENSGNLQAVDVRVTGIPLVANEVFVVLFLKDIGREKRAELIERAFFHDVLNTSHTLSSIISISTVSSEAISEPGRTIEDNITDIVEQIQYYQKLKFAEEGELCVEKSILNLSEEIDKIIGSVEGSSFCINKEIEVHLPDDGLVVRTDRVLYRRIVLNLLKNALEASRDGEKVSISLEEQADFAVFSVQNSFVMPENVRMQVFQRSFSTKGAGRGIGTYSAKLLGERYLNGNVTFTSNEEVGTVFIFRIPRQ